MHSVCVEIEYIRNQENSQSETKIFTEKEVPVHIKHALSFTMIDGKACNAATQTNSSMRCYLCGKTSKEFNNLEEETKT